MSLFAAVDLNWITQFIIAVVVVAFGLLHLIKNSASNYFLAEENEHDNDDVSGWSSSTSAAKNRDRDRSMMMTTTTRGATSGLTKEEDACAFCGNPTTKRCAGCKMVNYCSETCQKSHWKLEHKSKCKDFQLSSKSTLEGRKASVGSFNIVNRTKKILFPYDEFVNFFNWDKPGFPPCGLINCGNSCFANVVLQCLVHTKPLVAFLLEKGHCRECRRNDWCFLCEFQTHVERSAQSLHAFSPINILSRLPNIGGNLGYGKQEDAHEFMRFAIDTMQSVCLDEFGGEKAVHPTSQETTLVQHIFGGHLQSQVICSKCNNVSNQYENMMDLTVEIHGDATSLEECLDQFTAEERLHGDNMYKCDGCNDYVMAWKRLTVCRAPNVLTIALKRFQSGRFGKLNKSVTFPEMLDLSPYMSEAGEDNNLYKLYAVIVHVDMLNASFFGHYICYVKDFCGKWYRIDDCKVDIVDLDEVLSQGAYMLLYSRICARPASLFPTEPKRRKDEKEEVAKEGQPSSVPSVDCNSIEDRIDSDTLVSSISLPSEGISDSQVTGYEVSSSKSNSEDVKDELVDVKDPVPMDIDICAEVGSALASQTSVPVGYGHGLDIENGTLSRRHSTESDVQKMELSSSSSDGDCITRGTAGISSKHVSWHSLDEGSAANQLHICLKEQMPSDVPATSRSSVPLDQKESANCRKIRKTGCGDLLSSSIVGDAAEEVDGIHSGDKLKLPNCNPGLLEDGVLPSSSIVQAAVEELAPRCPGAKLKPIFFPGFLENKCPRREGTIPAESCEQASSGNMICNIDCDATPNTSYHCDLARSPFSTGFLEKHPQNKCIKGEGTVSVELCDRVSSGNMKCDGNGDAKLDTSCNSNSIAVAYAPGFLENCRQNKCIKREGKLPAEICEQVSQGNMNCEINGFAKPDTCGSSKSMRPLFTPGFLEKHRQNKGIKREGSVLAEQLCEEVSSVNANIDINGDAKSDTTHCNDTLGNAVNVYNSQYIKTSSVEPLEKQTAMCQKELSNCR